MEKGGDDHTRDLDKMENVSLGSLATGRKKKKKKVVYIMILGKIESRNTLLFLPGLNSKRN